MSEHLTALLERINAKVEAVKPVEKPPESPYLNALIGRVEARKWRDEMLQLTLERLEGLHDALEVIHHIRECSQCQVELMLDVERYAGSHCGLWYLDLSNDDFLPEYYEDCPPAEKYDFGSYWEGRSCTEGTRKFILDRIKWAEPKIIEEIYTVIEFYLALENWDLQSPLPPDTSDELLFRF
jgi:hypothetical protein